MNLILGLLEAEQRDAGWLSSCVILDRALRPGIQFNVGFVFSFWFVQNDLPPLLFSPTPQENIATEFRISLPDM